MSSKRIKKQPSRLILTQLKCLMGRHAFNVENTDVVDLTVNCIRCIVSDTKTRVAMHL